MAVAEPYETFMAEGWLPGTNDGEFTVKQTRQAALVVAVMVVLMAAWSLTVQGQAAGTRPTRIAVADIEHIFNALDQRQAIEADLLGRRETLDADANRRRQEIVQLQEDLAVLVVGTPPFRAKQEELERKTFEFDFWLQWQRDRLQRERALQTANLYRKILESIGRVAKDHNFDVVMFKEKPPEFGTAREDEIATRIQIRKVLWSAEDLDLTSAVLTRMNNEWRNVMGARGTN
jgi:Skp family chaperone for outer membrane proteins